ncbi:MAG TPA: hypothetical protein VLK35_02885 [Methylomirabilota bacterium]|jgi:hypothetical protein|nr:hypothetical protein [Methylomirabilota bacterium]
MLLDVRRTREGNLVYRAAVALTGVTVVVVAAVAFTDAGLAGLLVRENGPFEWLQVVLFAGAALICARLVPLERGAGRSGAPDSLLTASFAFMVVRELELPRLFLGRSIKITRLARDVPAGRPRDIIFVLVVAALTIGLGVYAFRRRAALAAWGRRALETPWGRLLLLGLSIVVLTQVFERPLNHLVSKGLPDPLLEETLELLAALYCFLALIQRRGSR